MDNLEETNSKNEQEKTSYVLEATPRPMTVADAELAEKLALPEIAEQFPDKNVVILYLDKKYNPASANERIFNNNRDRYLGLTKGEMVVLKCLCEGKTNKVIADELFVSVNTVKTHVRSIFQKLGVNTRSAAVRSAISNKLVELEVF